MNGEPVAVEVGQRRAIPRSVCEGCQARETLVVDRAEVKRGMYAMAVVCTACKKRTHACFTSDQLERLGREMRETREPDRKAKMERRHARLFERLQREMGAAG